jgi:hypothetical protein
LHKQCATAVAALHCRKMRTANKIDPNNDSLSISIASAKRFTNPFRARAFSEHRGRTGAYIGFGNVFNSRSFIGSGLRTEPAVQIPLLGNGAGKQFFQITAFQRPPFYHYVVYFLHGSLYEYLRMTLTTMPCILTRVPSRMIGSSASLAG